MSDENKYRNIFKSTFLFGFVQVFNIAVKVIINKVVALLLGASGMGVIGLYNSAIGMLKTGAGLGISQSAVRDISEAHGANDYNKFSKTISITNRVILFTSLLGVVITILLSPLLSRWSFGNNTHIIAFIWLSIVVGLNILSEGQLAILKGMRQLKALAKASLWGSIVGLISAVPFYYMWGEGGIVPSLMMTAFAALFFSSYYVRKIKYEKSSLTIKDVYVESKPMVKMGVSLMFTAFLANLATLVISSYMRARGGLSDVGYYNAGMMIINGYFGVIITALSTDYFPRISAVYKDNDKLQEELNQQSIVSLLICCPIIVLFLILLPLFITILYSKEFLPIMDFMKIAMFGTLITICSNQVDMILVAKFKIKVFTIISIIYRVVQVGLSLFLYYKYGLIGMGITLMLLGMIHMTIMLTVVYKLYHIHYNRMFLGIAGVVFILTILSVMSSYIFSIILRYVCGGILFFIALFCTLYISKKYLGLSLKSFIKINK